MGGVSEKKTCFWEPGLAGIPSSAAGGALYSAAVWGGSKHSEGGVRETLIDHSGESHRGWGVPAQPPHHFSPGRPEPPSLPGGEVGSEPPLHARPRPAATRF